MFPYCEGLGNLSTVLLHTTMNYINQVIGKILVRLSNRRTCQVFEKIAKPVPPNPQGVLCFFLPRLRVQNCYWQDGAACL